MADLRVLHTERDRCRQSVIETLETALEQAREGDVVAVGLAVVRPGGGGNTGFSYSDNVMGLLGAVDLLRHRLLRNIEE